jgi:hypothetical protein
MKRRRLNPPLSEDIAGNMGNKNSSGPAILGQPPLAFEFGFNNPKFSDHILHIRASEEYEHSEESISNADKGKKRKRVDCNGIALHVNSLLLSAHSDFFKSLFSNEMMESHNKEVSVLVAEEEMPLLEDIIRFIYTGKFFTQPADMLNLLFVADKLLFTRVAEDIIEHHKCALTIEKCCEYLELPDSFQLPSTFDKLLHNARKFLGQAFQSFDDMWNTERFKNLPARAVAAVLECDSLIVQSENTILCGLMEWVNADPTTRFDELSSFVKYLRFGHMDPSFLVDIVRRIGPIVNHADFEEIFKKVQLYKSQKSETLSDEPFMMQRNYTDKGSMKFTWNYRQISRLEESQPVSSDRFYWRGYYLYITVQRSNNHLEVSVCVDDSKSGIPAGEPITLKHESCLDLKNYYSGLYDRVVKYFTSYYGKRSYVLWTMDWAEFTNPQSPYVDHEDVLSLRLKVKLRSRGMCRLCGSLAYQLCGRCRGIYYCSKECQKQHWREHKKDCKPHEEMIDL